MTTILSNKSVKLAGLVILLLLTLGTIGSPVLAHEGEGDHSHCQNSPAVCLCETTSDAAEPLRIFFTILSVLGPVFGSLFYVGLSVAGAAQMKDEYKDDRRRVLLLGFSVPIAIAFLNVVGNELVANQDLNCFFP